MWNIHAFRQLPWPPFKLWCAIGERKEGNVRFVVNEEGDTKDEAIARLKLLLKP